MKFAVLTLSFFLFCLSAFAQVPTYVPTNGLVGYWSFNGNANDESGNVNNGTVNGATFTTDRFGVANKAFSFDGVNDQIEIAHHQTLNILSVSIAANPATKQLTISSSSSIEKNYILQFPQGIAILSVKLSATSTQLDHSKLARDNYLLLIGEKKTTLKLLKE